MPKLFYSPASPYARKVRVVAAEKNVALDVVNASVSPVARNAEVAAANPLGKVPCLVTDAGQAIYDSRVICEWLDRHGSGPRLMPEEPVYWEVKVQEALADGILDAALAHRYENFLRPEAFRWKEWSEGQWAKITASLDLLDGKAAGFGARADLGTIAVACALGYLDFRFAHMPWREGRPALARWYEAFVARPSMASTKPV